jgi:hypothetical protein
MIHNADLHCGPGPVVQDEGPDDDLHDSVLLGNRPNSVVRFQIPVGSAPVREYINWYRLTCEQRGSPAVQASFAYRAAGRAVPRINLLA